MEKGREFPNVQVKHERKPVEKVVKCKRNDSTPLESLICTVIRALICISFFNSAELLRG